jgi:hypothetical protein
MDTFDCFEERDERREDQAVETDSLGTVDEYDDWLELPTSDERG